MLFSKQKCQSKSEAMLGELAWKCQPLPHTDCDTDEEEQTGSLIIQSMTEDAAGIQRIQRLHCLCLLWVNIDLITNLLALEITRNISRSWSAECCTTAVYFSLGFRLWWIHVPMCHISDRWREATWEMCWEGWTENWIRLNRDSAAL